MTLQRSFYFTGFLEGSQSSIQDFKYQTEWNLNIFFYHHMSQTMKDNNEKKKNKT